mmetsp:Transcript_26382/g.83864  ORF Transcript_26382/g.83864 Transcript_26382/m.83864 type:complete len:279 (-) Transcript_26382:1652-2488(-)
MQSCGDLVLSKACGRHANSQLRGGRVTVAIQHQARTQLQTIVPPNCNNHATQRARSAQPCNAPAPDEGSRATLARQHKPNPRPHCPRRPCETRCKSVSRIASPLTARSPISPVWCTRSLGCASKTLSRISAISPPGPAWRPGARNAIASTTSPSPSPPWPKTFSSSGSLKSYSGPGRRSIEQSTTHEACAPSLSRIWAARARRVLFTSRLGDPWSTRTTLSGATSSRSSATRLTMSTRISAIRPSVPTRGWATARLESLALRSVLRLKSSALALGPRK